MSGHEVDIDMDSKDYDGDIEKYTVQTGGRVKIPDEWLDYLDLDEGENVIVKCEGDSVLIKEWSRENLQEISGD